MHFLLHGSSAATSMKSGTKTSFKLPSMKYQINLLQPKNKVEVIMLQMDGHKQMYVCVRVCVCLCMGAYV